MIKHMLELVHTNRPFRLTVKHVKINFCYLHMYEHVYLNKHKSGIFKVYKAVIK